MVVQRCFVYWQWPSIYLEYQHDVFRPGIAGMRGSIHGHGYTVTAVHDKYRVHSPLPPRCARLACFNPFRTAVPFWGQTTLISSNLSPKRDCGSKGPIEKSCGLRRYAPGNECLVPLFERTTWYTLDGVTLLLRGTYTILNRIHGTHKNLYTSLFFLTMFGPIYYGPP